ncbi:PKD domain-containing protein [Marinilabiliaceae bacterium ANBcel2]|nr:PKD domain-containing protein [Marinilabiliaceae bacterium ANBcel2]
MKQIKNIFIGGIALIVSLAVVSCEDDIKPEEMPGQTISFSYYAMTVDGPSIDYVVGSEIHFENKSVEGSSWEWSFGDGNTSNEENPVHIYEEPGTYDVVLSIDDGKYIQKQRIFISPIVPIVNYRSDDEVLVYQQSSVTFDVSVDNPAAEEVHYEWVFPAGTTGDDIDEEGRSTADNPEVVFGSIGSQRVRLTVTVGDNELETVTTNINVNYNEPARTLFYAEQDGNIKAKKLIEDLDPELNNPFDFGYRSGKHPLSLQFSDDWLYVFDAGTYTGFVNDHQNAGDGEIFVISHDGSRRETVIENFGGDTFLDFYYGFVDEEENMIYWTDRREGIFRIPSDTRNASFSLDEYDYYVRNNWLGYYGSGIAWGNTNGPIIKRDDGVYWWAKNSTGRGVFRFEDTDIAGSPVEDTEPHPEAGAIYQGAGDFSVRVRGMIIDEVNGHIYVADQDLKRITRHNIDNPDSRDNAVIIDRPGADSGEGGVAESLFITDFAIDVNPDGSGYLYWAYRGPSGSEDPDLQSGIKRLELGNPDAEPEYYLEGVNVYGLAVDPTER